MWALTLRRIFIHSFHLSATMVAIISAPKPLPISTIPLCPPSYDFHPIYKTTVEKDLSNEDESRLARHFRWTAVVLYLLFVLVGASVAVCYCTNSATMDIRIPHPSHNESLSIANHRSMGKMKDSNLHFVQISFYVMARFQHPDVDVTVDSITVSVYNGLTRVGGGEYLPSRGRDYPFIHTEGDITEITMLPKATLLEEEVGYKECSSMDSAPLSLRIYYSILVHTKNFFGNEIKGRIEYSKVYSVCCSCQKKQEYLRVSPDNEGRRASPRSLLISSSAPPPEWSTRPVLSTMSADRTTLVLAPATASRVEAADEAVKTAIKQMKAANGRNQKNGIARVREALEEWLRATDEAACRDARCSEKARIDNERNIEGVIVECDAKSRAEAYRSASNCTGLVNFETKRIADDKFAVRLELNSVLRAVLTVSRGVDYYKDGVYHNVKARFPTIDFVGGHARSLYISGFPASMTEELRESLLAHFSAYSSIHESGGKLLVGFNELDDADLAGVVFNEFAIAGFCLSVVPVTRR